MSKDTGVVKISSSLYASLKPAVEAIDSNVKNVFDSQTLLNQQLDVLSATLDEFKALEELPDLASYTEKLSVSQKKLHSQSSDLANISRRIESIRSLIQRRIATAPQPSQSNRPQQTTQKSTTVNQPVATSKIPASSPVAQPQPKSDPLPESGSGVTSTEGAITSTESKQQQASEDSTRKSEMTVESAPIKDDAAKENSKPDTELAVSGPDSSLVEETNPEPQQTQTSDATNIATKAASATDRQRLKELIAWDQ